PTCYLPFYLKVSKSIHRVAQRVALSHLTNGLASFLNKTAVHACDFLASINRHRLSLALFPFTSSLNVSAHWPVGIILTCIVRLDAPGHTLMRNRSTYPIITEIKSHSVFTENSYMYTCCVKCVFELIH
ncbi:MAG: hypothetical protein FD143_2983, partial [Ignavibacteria bacterium]